MWTNGHHPRAQLYWADWRNGVHYVLYSMAVAEWCDERALHRSARFPPRFSLSCEKRVAFPARRATGPIKARFLARDAEAQTCSFGKLSGVLQRQRTSIFASTLTACEVYRTH